MATRVRLFGESGGDRLDLDRMRTGWGRCLSRREEDLAEIWNADDRRHALDAVDALDAAYGAKFGEAVAKITDDVGELVAFLDYPAEHRAHPRVSHRTKVTTVPGSRAAGLAMAFKPSPARRWFSSLARICGQSDRVRRSGACSAAISKCT